MLYCVELVRLKPGQKIIFAQLSLTNSTTCLGGEGNKFQLRLQSINGKLHTNVLLLVLGMLIVLKLRLLRCVALSATAHVSFRF